jgi:hypothetical protein
VLLIDKSWHLRLVHVGYDGSEHFVANLSKVIDALLEEPEQVRNGILSSPAPL